MRLKDRVAIVVGAGQTPGETMGNGRATSLLFAREGAKLVLADRNLTSAEETRAATGMVAYKTSQAALNALTQTLAMANARYGIRVNAILPGLMNTPMAIEGISAARGISREQLIAERDRQVPLGKMGTAWDVASAALFLASDDAQFITGVLLPVDGGQSIRVG